MPKITKQVQPDGLNLTTENESPLSDYFSLSRTNRMYACGGCFVLGFVLCILSVVMLSLMNMTGFAIFYTLGNIIALFGTMFLIGPMRQLKLAVQPVRLIATIVYVVTLALTLVAAIALDSVVLSIIMVIVQFCALVWYCASYVPFGRKIIEKTCGACLT
ncbi:Got1/Sft2-like family-domain-containing protein [Dimargaris cristalligena]|uniref:Protein transport protein SFT2 n=1 Tax=Dimargaris cristalligena TaxID=215637 RepID=A0A4Q0A4A9_9FUNG|nr:Got1/Sft2-like family-domain-containing protein [Dimargaris cristalligena]|eukprot:RKP40411.1 Got1/Sft2-like family-domain-containing protein [Dimargaris cristalligena]